MSSQQQEQQPQPTAMPSFLQWHPNTFLDKLICACGSPESQVFDETYDSGAQKNQTAYYDMNGFADKDPQPSIHRKETLPMQNTSPSTSYSRFQSRPIEGTLSFMELDDSIREQAPRRMGSDSIFSRGGVDSCDSSSSVDCFKHDLSSGHTCGRHVHHCFDEYVLSRRRCKKYFVDRSHQQLFPKEKIDSDPSQEQRQTTAHQENRCPRSLWTPPPNETPKLPPR
jgi:hypothetical protein